MAIIIIFFSDIPARNKPFRKERGELPGSGNFPAGAARRRGHAHREGDSGESALTGAPSPPFGPSCSSHGSRNLAVSPLRRSPATLTFIAREAPFVLSPQPHSPPAPGEPQPLPLAPLAPLAHPSGTYVVGEGKGPSEEWFITRDWKSVRLKTSSQPAAIFLIEDRSPPHTHPNLLLLLFPKSARQ